MTPVDRLLVGHNRDRVTDRNPPVVTPPRVRRIRLAYALFGFAIAVLGLASLRASEWRTYVLFTPLVVLSYFFTLPLPPPVRVMLLPYLSIMSAFVYIAGLPIIGLDWAVRIIVYPVTFALARRGLIEVPRFMQACYDTFTNRRPILNDDHVDEWAVVATGAMGFAIRIAVFQFLTGPMVGWNPIVCIMAGELFAIGSQSLVMLVLPLPYSDMMRDWGPRRMIRGESTLDPRPDAVIAVLFCQPSLVLLIYYGFIHHGIVGAAVWSIATLGPHYLLKLLNQHLLALADQHRDLETASLHLQEANHALQDKALALEQKQEELRNFVYTVTHDLKNPLGAIQITADLLRESTGNSLNAESRDHLERITRLATHTDEMIRDLMEFFKITSTPEPTGWVDLRAVVGKCLDTFQPQLNAKGVKVEVEELPRVWGEFAKLSHVVSNLMSNAIKYVPPGRGEIHIGGHVENGHARLCVGDNGIGIPMAYQRGIFELFARVPAKEQGVDGNHVAGTGVGLAIVKRIVEAHHGRVWVESEPGAGARFYVELPAKES